MIFNYLVASPARHHRRRSLVRRRSADVGPSDPELHEGRLGCAARKTEQQQRREANCASRIRSRKNASGGTINQPDPSAFTPSGRFKLRITASFLSVPALLVATMLMASSVSVAGEKFHFDGFPCLDEQRSGERCVSNGLDALNCHKTLNYKGADRICYKWDRWVLEECRTWLSYGRIYGDTNGLSVSELKSANRREGFRCIR